MDESAAVDGLRYRLDDAVAMHLRSDVPVGSCLSGGLDSSSLVCLMARQLPSGTALHTFSACYEDRSVDERRFMEAVVAATGAKAQYVYPRPEDVFAEAERITWHQDEPFASTSILAQWSVFSAAKAAGIKVMLDGQGLMRSWAATISPFRTTSPRCYARGGSQRLCRRCLPDAASMELRSGCSSPA